MRISDWSSDVCSSDLPEAKTYRIYAAGMRNPNGVDFDPATGQMWAVVNERDMMGSDLPPDYLTTVALGDFFGWPWFYWGGYPDTRVEPQNPAMQEYSKRSEEHTSELQSLMRNSYDV